MKKGILSLLFLVMTTYVASAQDIHFSQFYMSPLNLNPAMTGLHNCTGRATVNYRNQWSGVVGADSYNSFSASYDMRMPAGRDDQFAVGGVLWGDVAGESNYGMSQIKLTGSYSKQIVGDNRGSASYLVMGAEAGFTQRRISIKDLRWPTQYSNGIFDPSIPSGEGNLTKDNIFYPDLGVGLMWYSIIDEYFWWYLGAAGHHVNRPNISFLNKRADLSVKITGHAGLEYPISDGMNILPHVVYMKQGPHWQTTAGSSVRFKLNQRRYNAESWQLGLWYRLGSNAEGSLHSDAIILSSRINLDQLTFGFSYDATISKLRQTGTGVGSFEFSVMYKICGSFSRGVYCPKF